MGLLSNVDSVIYVDVKRPCMRFIHFTRNTDIVHWMIVCGKTLLRVRRPLKKKWNGNLWVRRVILNLVNELDKESQEHKERQLEEM